MGHDPRTDDALLEAPIVQASVRTLGLPTGMKSFVLPNGHRTPTELSVLLVRVVDRDGATGEAVLWAQRPEQLPLFGAALRYLAPVILRPDPLSIAGTVHGMRQAIAFVGAEGVAAFGVSGFEMALQDLHCRRRDVALSDALGRRRDRIRAYQTGLMLPSSIDELVDEAATICARGVKAIKMIVGIPDIHEDAARIEAVRASLPADVALMVDALQRWDVAQALEAVKQFAELDLVWLEDPLPHHDIDGYRALVDASAVPIATGETCFAPESFDALLDAGVPYVIGELERVGGVGGWMGVAERVHERGALMLPHIYPHVSAQVIAALPQHEVWWEYVPWFDGIADEPFAIADGEVTVSHRPGIGFDVSPDAVERYATGPWLTLSD
jgi:L-alanine-DL-glutamate epimerase-like enolase superfamily enzyme